ncbi:MAG: hypothetical protein HQ536_02705 [Parcubacteria group bacterium]|nr:hypothetical protein [Parcubacteria group bacterium]
MGKAAVYFFAFISLLMCSTAGAEQASQDNGEPIKVSHSPENVRISYTHKNRTVATYTRYLHYEDSPDRLVVFSSKSSHVSVFDNLDILVSRSGKIKSARVNLMRYTCESSKNSEMCNLIQGIADAWIVRLDVENSIIKGLTMPIWNPEQFMPPQGRE